MASTIMILYDIVYISILSSDKNEKNIKPFGIFISFTFELVGSNLMMASILWSYLGTGKDYFVDYEYELNEKI